MAEGAGNLISVGLGIYGGKMDKVTKATLTLLIAEIQACQDMAEVNRVLDSWIKANDLHPEEVKTFGANQVG